MIWKIYLSSGIKTRYSSHVSCLLTIQGKEDFVILKKVGEGCLAFTCIHSYKEV